MKRIFLLFASAGLLLLGACGSDSSLPQATGKGSVRAFNAIPTSQEINFLIEERQLGSAPYKDATTPEAYDDLDYTFNFEAFFSNDGSFRRVASQALKVEADKEYTFLISGNLANPTITVWQDDERVFDEADTVFALRLAHASTTLGSLDYYFADPGVAPVLGNAIATLSSGEISTSADYPAGQFVLTITTAGDPVDVLYVSGSNTFNARDSLILAALDGDAGDTAPVFVRGLSNSGANLSVPDVTFPPTAQFINATMDLGNVDIYDDEMLTSLRVSNHDFLDVTSPLDIALGENTFYYTPAGDPSVVSIEIPLTAFGGLRYRLVAVGPAGQLISLAFIPDVRPVESQVKVLPYNASNNFNFVDLYFVEPDTSVDDFAPVRAGLATGFASTPGALPSGSYDIYITPFGGKDVLAGPYRVDVALGDVVDLVVVDTVDPALLDILFLDGGPTP